MKPSRLAANLEEMVGLLQSYRSVHELGECNDGSGEFDWPTIRFELWEPKDLETDPEIRAAHFVVVALYDGKPIGATQTLVDEWTWDGFLVIPVPGWAEEPSYYAWLGVWLHLMWEKARETNL